MSEYLPDLITRLRLDESDMQAGVGRAAALGGAIGGALGGVLAQGISSALGSIRDFVTGSVTAFAELEDSTAAAGTVFGDAFGAIQEQAAGAAEALGLSSSQVIAANTQFGVFGKAAGLAGGDLSGFSTDLTSLAGDLASFYGKPVEDAIAAIGSGLRGEAEPLRQFGVLLDDATLQSRALAMGIGDGTTPLTQQQKVLAAQAEILAQTTLAQGDYLRTADSTANVQKTLAAATDDLQSKFGTLLAPAFTAARSSGIDMVSSLSSWLDGFIPKFQTFTAGVSGGLSSLFELVRTGDFTAAIGEALNVEEDSPIIGLLLGVRDTAVTVFAAIRPAFETISAAIEQLAPTFGTLIPQVLEVVTAFSPLHLVLNALLPVLPVLADLVATVATTLVGAASEILPAILDVGEVLAGSLADAMVDLAPIIADIAEQLAGVLGEAVVALAPIITTLVPVIAQLASMLGGVLGSVITALTPVFVQLAGIITQLMPIVLQLVPPIMSVVTALLPLIGVIGDLIVQLLPPLLDLFMAVIEPIAELAGVLAEALAPLLTLVADLLAQYVVPFLSALIGVVGDVITWVLELVGPALGGLVSMLSTVIGWIANVIGVIADWAASLDIGAAIDTMASAVSDGIDNIVQWFVGLPGRILAVISGLGGRLWDTAVAAIQGFVDGIRSMAGRIIDTIKEYVTDAVPDWIKDVFGIASPSKLFRKLGAYTGEGFALGLADSGGMIDRAAQDMVAGVVGMTVAPPMLADPQFAAAMTGGGTYGTGSRPAVQVRVFLGDEELTDRLRVEVLDVLESEAASIGAGSAG